MASWQQVEAEAPELVARARPLFDANKHKTLATLRRDGSPRISGTEIIFADGDLWFGSMWKAVKALDLRRDPRFAIHSASDGADWSADAKFAGRAEEVSDPGVMAAVVQGEASPGSMHLFRAEVTELVVTSLGGDPPDHLVIESWHEGRGVERRERR
jgi:Pyridoxamine 5'-phosphate oxidase